MKSKNITIKTLIISKREKDIKGVHTVFYKSAYDEIEITHYAKNRDTFARGAIMSAEWLVGKKGFYTFNDCLKNEKISLSKKKIIILHDFYSSLCNCN